MTSRKWILLAGDVGAIALITFAGFATHGEANLAFLPRMAAAFFPLVISWLLLAFFVGLFQDRIVRQARQLWRPALTALFAAPLAAVLRGFILNTPVIPIFAAVLAATSALGMVIWRALYLLWNRKVS
jgi:hypothetical protein